MSRNVIEVPIARKDEAVMHMMWKDPSSGKEALLGKDYVNQKNPSENYVEIYDASGNTVFEWKAASGKSLDQNRFKTASFIARQSFELKGVN